ncbi:F0F1 ATP synthase subunit B [Georgenia sp. EYE_87]|uniref:F0F1 ATP synthase subunit B n=1 Tax=Georgenia sp. EYE_87 TaxID=2853448 RepID=UPI0020031E05|nr:F0F1 ATP synthase subunit B [Georgenia sp. EYE_87]MCK6212649.1 F0F1 ATP synthase subunit B [Georgenia sp. EYE_87]
MQPTALVRAEVTQNPLLPADYDIIWSLVCLAIIAFFLVKYAVPRLTSMLDERAEKIETGLQQAERAQQAAADAEERIAAELAQARRDAAEVREKAQEEGKAIVAEARNKAQVEADRVTENAARQIEADRQAAQISLRTDVGLLATELASRIVGESVSDHALQSRVIDRFLDELEAQPADRAAAADREA